MQTDNNTIDSLMQSFLMIAGYHGLAVDESQIRHQFCIENSCVTVNKVQIIAKKYKLKSKHVKCDIQGLLKLKPPCIIKIQNDYCVLAGVNKDDLLVFNPLFGKSAIVKVEALTEHWDGYVLLFIPRTFGDNNFEFGIKWFIPTIIKYKSALFEVLLAALFMQLLSLLSPLITQSVIDKVLVHNSMSTLDILMIGLFVIMLFESVLSVSRAYVLNHTTSKIDVILSCRLFEHLFHLPLRYFENRRVGETVARVRELENIRRFLTGVPMTTILDVLFISVYLVVMVFYSPLLTIVTVASIPVLALISWIITPMLKTRLDEKFKYGSEMQSYLVEAVTGINTIKAFSIENRMKKKWEDILANSTKANFKMNTLSNSAGVLAQFVQKIVDLSILYLGARLVMNGTITVGQMIAFRMLSGRVSQPVLRLVQMWQEFQQTSLSIQRLGEIFNTKTETTLNKNKTKLPSIVGNIEFSKVSFRYRIDGAETIKNMSFEIEAGKVVGIVGRSGSGKSTLSKLIQRLYLPESGKIMVDGIDLSMADPIWLRRQIGVVLQENFMFNQTIRDNIAIDKPSAPIEEIIAVAQIAGIHEFICELPEAYDTMIGENGVGLSGGQKQRVAIARALLSNPKILIFDEATSALDYESEKIIQTNLKEICKGRTVIIIAHRLSTLKDADKIMVIERGELVEYDDRIKLINSRGAFFEMLSQQM